MISSVSKWISEHYPVFFIFLMILIGSIAATIYIMTVIQRFVKVEKACEGLPDMKSEILTGVNLSKTIENKIDSQGDKFNIQSEKFNVLSQNITALIAFLTTKHADLQSGLFQSYSPIQLTEIGLDLLAKSGGKDYIETHISALLEDMEKQNFKSGLDVQNYANTIIFREFHNDGFIHIRNYMFQNPVFKPKDSAEIPVNNSNINQIMGIFLRDKYFEKHPELKDIE